MVGDTARSETRSVDTYLELHRKMLLIRHFELNCQDLYAKGLLHGTTHLCNGQEAIAVGANTVLGSDDRVACTYRGHGHALALGMDPEALFAELLGRSTGICGGRAGSMNMIDLEHRLVGCFGIVGGSIAAATGAGLALKRSGGVAVAYFGDGAVNQAYFSECLNFARLLRLPAIYVCENNLYGEFTPMEQVTAGSILGRVRALDIPAEQIDGNDVRVVQSTMMHAAAEARAGRGPIFVEAMTYRLAGHSKSDTGLYRKAGELEKWKERDPLKLSRSFLMTDFSVTSEDLDRIEHEVLRQLVEARRLAEAAPFPAPGDQGREFKQG